MEIRNKHNSKSIALNEKYFNKSHYMAYGARILGSTRYLKRIFVAIDSDEDRYHLVKNILIPAHIEIYMGFMRGWDETFVINKMVRKLRENSNKLNEPEFILCEEIKYWFLFHLKETERLRSHCLHGSINLSDEDALLVLCAVETQEPNLFYSDELINDSKELKTFMIRCVRRGRGFTPEYIADCLGITLAQAKSQSIFSDGQMGKLLQLSEESIANLLNGCATPTELGAVARKARFLTRSMRELKELRNDSHAEYVAAADDGKPEHFNVHDERVVKEVQKALKKYSKLTTKNNKGNK